MVRIPRGLGIFEADAKHNVGIGVRGRLMAQLSSETGKAKGHTEPLLAKLSESGRVRDDALRL